VLADQSDEGGADVDAYRRSAQAGRDLERRAGPGEMVQQDCVDSGWAAVARGPPSVVIAFLFSRVRHVARAATRSQGRPHGALPPPAPLPSAFTWGGRVG